MEIICILYDTTPDQYKKLKKKSAANILNLESIFILNCYHWQFRKKFKCIENIDFYTTIVEISLSTGKLAQTSE